VIENVFNVSDLRALARKRARASTTKSVHPKLVTEEIEKGWTFVKKNKASVKLSKPKPHGEVLEDRVWMLLYRMQFSAMSGEKGAHLSLDSRRDDSPTSQLDVVGVDDELALAIECKSAERPSRRPQFQEELGKLALARERFARAINEQFPSKARRQIVFVFFLSNINLSTNDKDRAKEANVLVFDDKDLEYYERLTKHLGPAAKYQFFADMLPGKSIPGLEIRVPAVKTKMGGFNCYTFPLSPTYLLKISYVSHRSKGKASDVHTYQRMIKKSRLNKIREYISNSGVFPTNIVVNLDKKRLNFERIKQSNSKDEQIESGILGWLDIRPAYKSAWIIDGQHRLFAYSGHPRADSSHLAVLGFEGLPPSKQAQLFIDINAKQQSVKQSLLQELYAELHWDAEEPSVRVRAIVSKAVQILDADPESPLYQRIQAADAVKDSLRCITLTSLFSAIEKTGFHIVKEKKGAVLEYGPLWAGDNDGTLRRTVYILKHWLAVISQGTREWWNLGSAEGGGLAMNDGVTTCINVLRSVFQHLDQGRVKLIHLDDEDLGTAIEPYAISLGQYFGTLTQDERKRFRDLRGIQGQTTRTRRCQQAVRRSIPAFNPAGLDEFIKLEKEQTNLKAKEVIDRLERTLKAVVIEELKSEFGSGDNEWWLLGVPKKVRTEVSDRFENDDGKRGAKEHYFELMDYRRIALEQWTLFEPIVGYGKGGNKEKRTKWLVTVNEKRNIVSHVSSGITLSLEELGELEEFEVWLNGQIAGTGQQGSDVDAGEAEISLNETEQS
jgi:DNA sulfur modification protein DndB